MPSAQGAAAPQPAGDFFSGETQVEYQQFGRRRWRMGYPESEGEPGRIYFRVLPPDWVPGLDVPAYPVFYFVHVVPDAMLNKAGDFKRNVFCLGSPRAPEPASQKWVLDEAGVQQCSSIVLPCGTPLHNSSDPVQRILLPVFQYTDGQAAVNELRFWEPKVGPKSRGIWDQLRRADEEAKREGTSLDQVVCAVERQMRGSFPNWVISTHHAGPSTEYGQRFPFGDAQRHIVHSMAPKFVENFFPYRDKEGVLRQLNLDQSSQSAAPPLHSGTAGPTAPRPGSGMEI